MSYSYESPDEADEEQEMDPPLSEDEEVQEEDNFLADMHDDYPEGLG